MLDFDSNQLDQYESITNIRINFLKPKPHEVVKAKAAYRRSQSRAMTKMKRLKARLKHNSSHQP